MDGDTRSKRSRGSKAGAARLDWETDWPVSVKAAASKIGRNLGLQGWAKETSPANWGNVTADLNSDIRATIYGWHYGCLSASADRWATAYSTQLERVQRHRLQIRPKTSGAPPEKRLISGRNGASVRNRSWPSVRNGDWEEKRLPAYARSAGERVSSQRLRVNEGRLGAHGIHWNSLGSDSESPSTDSSPSLGFRRAGGEAP